jgi:hypothetical protein
MSTFDREQALTDALRQIGADAAAVAAPPELEERLLREVRALGPARPARRSWRAAWLAAAAALLVAAAVPVWRLANAPHARAVPDVASPTVRAVDLPVTPAVPEKAPSIPASATPPIAAAKAPHAARPTRSRPREVVTDFMPLTYGTLPVAGGQIVRLSVPRSALASFGLASEESMSAGTVLADVIVGDDGLARAVRFVRGRAPVR